MPEEQRALVGRLVEAAKADGRELVGLGGMPAGLVKFVLKTTLQGEMDTPLGRSCASGSAVQHVQRFLKQTSGPRVSALARIGLPHCGHERRLSR